MKYMKLSMCFISFSLFFNHVPIRCMLDSSVCTNEDADKKYVQATHEALKHMGIDPTTIAVKKLNVSSNDPCKGSTNGKTIWLQHPPIGSKETDIIVTSLNDTFIATHAGACRFACYHEAAHCKLKHISKPKYIHQGLKLGTFLASGLLCIAACKKLGAHMSVLPVILSSLGICPFYEKIAHYGTLLYNKYQEKEADIYAARILMETGQESILQEYLDLVDKIEFERSKAVINSSNPEDVLDQVYNLPKKRAQVEFSSGPKKVYFNDTIDLSKVASADLPAFKREFVNNLISRATKLLNQQQTTPWWSTRTHYHLHETGTYLRDYRASKTKQLTSS